jgi:hypothetical protein
MLHNKQTNSVLACPKAEKIIQRTEGYLGCAVDNCSPCVGSVFVVQKAEKDFFTDDLVHYGQKIRLAVNPRLSKNPMWLHSSAITPSKYAKKSRKQETGFIMDGSVSTVWEIEHLDAKIRFESYGEPVKACDPILLKHSFTGQWLASDTCHASKCKTTGMTMYEVFGHSYQMFNKTQNLIAEKMGRNTIDIPLRGQHDQNIWAFCTAKSPEQEFDESKLNQPVSAAELVGNIKKALAFNPLTGPFGIREMTRIFMNICEKGSTAVGFEDFKWGLKNVPHIQPKLTAEETQTLFSHFEKNGSGKVCMYEFAQCIRVPFRFFSYF